jgi:hypothetical protein
MMCDVSATFLGTILILVMQLIWNRSHVDFDNTIF